MTDTFVQYFIKLFRLRYLIPGILGILLIVFIWSFFIPKHFDDEKVVSIPEGATLDQAAEILKRSDVLRSESLFKLFIVVRGYENAIKRGVYVFNGYVTTLDVVNRVVQGNSPEDNVSITIPEGFTRFQIAESMAAKLPEFDAEAFLEETKTKEGFLFPDTYFFFPSANEHEVINAMEKNFDQKTAPLRQQIESSTRALGDIVKMASIIEREARQYETMRLVSGILWKRLDRKMPLQVDATFVYGIGKATEDLTLEDLRTDGPYNSYTRLGLPPTAISNPGLDAIRAALNPQSSQYLYFLTDKDGTMHYAKTHEEHVLNKEKYLK